MQVQAPAAAVAAVAANENRGFSPSWTPNWGPSAATVTNNTNITISSVASNNSSASKAPINPFTGEFYSNFSHGFFGILCLGSKF
jgi:hypothetical protein